MIEGNETLSWEQQAAIYQNALETALLYQRELEQEVSDLRCSLRSCEDELFDLERTHEATLHQRDQVINSQAKEIAHVSHILQIQQQLLRSRKLDTK